MKICDEYRKAILGFVERQCHLHRRPPNILVAPDSLDVFYSELRSASENPDHSDQQECVEFHSHDMPPNLWTLSNSDCNRSHINMAEFI